MNSRRVVVALLVCTLGASACSSESRQSLKTDLATAASDVSNAAGDAADNAVEALARNIATQQGEEQFKNAGQELSGALSCDATVNAGVAKVDVNCTGTTKSGGKAALTGSTNEVPGASVTELDGQFTGTVDGAQVFSTQRLGG
ncbi:MAG: hypothetical protein JWN62_4184 [Acidimicrobiales bacterium]|nr:hypothetical protein [Acidimicrobiales bacterium]